MCTLFGQAGAGDGQGILMVSRRRRKSPVGFRMPKRSDRKSAVDDSAAAAAVAAEVERVSEWAKERSRRGDPPRLADMLSFARREGLGKSVTAKRLRAALSVGDPVYMFNLPQQKKRLS